MLGALALASVIVQPGQTLSGIASSHNVSLAAVEQANKQIKNPNLIYVGEKIYIPKGGTYSSWTTSTEPSAASPSQSSYSSSSSYSTPSSSTGSSGTSSSYSGGGLSDVPGVPSSFASCVAERESTDLQNPAANGNAYGIIPASGHNVEGQSLSAQKAAFREIYDTTGPSAWSASDGC